MDPSPTNADTGSAGRIVHDRLLELSERLAVDESRVRRRLPDGVHRMRVTLRRLRSLLASFGILYDGAAVEFLGEELRWIAGELGNARDVEVLRLGLRTLAGTPEERVLVDRIDRAFGAAESASMEASVLALDTPRYQRAVRALGNFVARPPWTLTAGLPADLLRSRVRRDWKRLRRRAVRAQELTDPIERRASLHDVRKSAKRLRYAAETLVPAYGDPAARLVRRAKRVQTELGDLQDCTVVQARLRELADLAETTADEAALLDALVVRVEQRAARAEDRYAETWVELARRRNHRWLGPPDRIVNSHRAKGIDRSAPLNPES